MSVVAILEATVLIGAVGIIVGICLGIFGTKFAVEIDPKEIAIRAALPGNNCGACGYPGCDGCAKAINEGKAPATACPVGRQPCWDKIKAILAGETPAE